ncbi:MAG: hypothetical protein GY870_12680 [archaeon]|nr:hypothetical protein [archaeon]
MNITVLFGNSIKKEDIEGIESYFENVEVSKEYNDITPKKISNISPFLKVMNNKKEQFFIQFYIDYYNKIGFKTLNEYLKFLTNVKMFDYRARAILTVINSEVMDDKTNNVELNAF